MRSLVQITPSLPDSRSHQKARYANRTWLFDLDNTLLDGDSDYLWGQFLVERGLVRPAVQRGRRVNRIRGPESLRLPEAARAGRFPCVLSSCGKRRDKGGPTIRSLSVQK